LNILEFSKKNQIIRRIL